MHEYILLHAPKIVARRFAIMPTWQAFVMCASFEERKTAFASWSRRYKHCAGRKHPSGKTHESFMDMPFVCSFDEEKYGGRLFSLITWLCVHGVAPEGLTLYV